MDQKLLNGRRREHLGKTASAKYRREGRLPAVMYDRSGKSVPIDICQREFSKLFKDITESTVIAVKLDDKDEFEVFVKDYQYDIITDSIKHVDFYEVERGKLLRARIPIRLSGSPEGVRQGAVLEAGVGELEVECLPRHLPARIVVDVSNLDLNESLHVRDINLSSDVKVLTDPDLAVAILKFASSGSAETEEEEEGITE